MEKNNTIQDRLRRIETLLLNQKNVLNFNEVSDYTGLSKSYLYKLTCSAGIPCYKPNGKHIYFNKQEIDSWLLKNRKATIEEIQDTASKVITLKKGVRL